MLFFPFEKMVMATDLGPEEVLQQLCEYLERDGDIKYDGEITGQSFKITRRMNYRNSFRPLIQGRVYPKDIGALVIVTMRLGTIASLVFLYVLIFGAMMLIGGAVALINGHPFPIVF